jgi:hypothetical protein
VTVIAKLTISTEIDSVIGLGCLVLNYVKVEKPESVIEPLETPNVVVVRVGGDEPRDSFAARLPGKLIDDVVLMLVYSAVDDREVVRVVPDVVGVPVAGCE